ncbi:MAG: hypothetical protein IPF98_01985 [Gemmatimonadetes bacterium]|nr:hypothetical protein [Gemmatimonadota bacterium]
MRMALRALPLAFALAPLTAALTPIDALAQPNPAKMTFFITSAGLGNGADLGGLAGADQHCAMLAKAAGAGEHIWHAYLSTSATDGKPAVNARDRIGTGPWYNATGVMIAQSVAHLHDSTANTGKQTSLDEKGGMVNGRGDTPNTHDILTGSTPDGRAYPPGTDTTCNNWTSSGDGSARVGHHDRQGGGEFPTSWNAAHPSRGCSQDNLKASGGAALFYCFGIN